MRAQVLAKRGVADLLRTRRGGRGRTLCGCMFVVDVVHEGVYGGEIGPVLGASLPALLHESVAVGEQTQNY